MSSFFSSSLPTSLSIDSDSSDSSLGSGNGNSNSNSNGNGNTIINKQLNQVKGQGNKELKNSFNGISSDIDKISLYSKDINCILACDVNRENEIKEAELLFENLPELVYNVTKINQWGKHQKRNLRLTNKGIENIRNGDFVSSLYHYSDIKTIYNKDSETFVIEYKNATHNYIYKSSIGYQIVQEISSRLKLKQATEKKKSGYDIAMEFQKKFLHTKRLSEKVQVTALLNIHNENNNISNNNNNSISINNSNSISDNKSPKSPNNSASSNSSKKSSNSANSMSRSSSFENYTGDDGSSVSSSPSSPTNSNIDYDDYDSISQVNKQTKRATKVSQLLGTTEEQRVQSEVDKIILSPTSNERKSIQQFMSNFNVLLKNPATATMIIRQFLDTARQNILNEYKDISKVMVVPNSPTGTSGFTNSTGSLPGVAEEIDISMIVEKSLEKAVILRANKQISTILSQQVQKDEMILQDHISKLCTKSQAFFGIKDEFISSNNWKYAILELSCLGRCEIPHDKLCTILSSAKAIYNTINYEKNMRNKDQQDYFISADDFLPIYLYVVVNSGVKELEYTNQYLWQLSDPEKLGGEGGYYLTVFSSTLSLIKSLNMDTVEKATIIDDLIPSIQLKEDIQPPSSCNSASSSNNGSHSTSPHSLRQSSDSFGSWHGARISKKERNQSFNFGDKSLSDKSK